MVDKSEANEALRTILAQAERLEDYLSDTDDDAIQPRAVRNQYQTLRQRVVLLDPISLAHLPYIEALSLASPSEQIEEVVFGIGQMIAYLQSKTDTRSETVDSTMVSPIVNFLETLESRGLTIRWGIAAAALSLVEVITNQSLAKLNIDSSGEFDKRLNKLSSTLKQKGIEIPSLLLSGLYKVRSKVIHEGREPTAEEMTTIFQILNSLHEKTK